MAEDSHYSLAAEKERIRIYTEGYDAYSKFRAETGFRYEDDLTAQDYERARKDSRLTLAKARILEAGGLAEKAGRIHDAAVAKMQAAQVCLARGEFSEGESLVRQGLEVLTAIPVPDLSTTKNVGLGHYFLGIAMMKQGREEEAHRELLLAKKIDAAIGNFGEIATCDRALEKCRELLGKAAGPRAEVVDNTWVPPCEGEPVPVEEEEQGLSRSSPNVVRSGRPLAVWIASLSEGAGQGVRTHLGHLEDSAGRPVSVGFVSFGVGGSGWQGPAARRVEGEHLCAVVVVIGREALLNPSFQSMVISFTGREARPDFRLFIFLEGMSVADLRALPQVLGTDQHEEAARVEEVVTAIFDSTQVGQWTSLDRASHSATPAAREAALFHMARTLVRYVSTVERQHEMAGWKGWLHGLEAMGGWLATGIIGAALLLTLMGIAAMLAGVRSLSATPWWPALASAVVGILAFPINSLLLFQLLRGVHFSNWMILRSRVLRWWLLGCPLILGGGGHLRQSLAAPNSWFFLGCAAGVVLDGLRRSGYTAERRRKRIKAADARDQAMMRDERDAAAIHHARADDALAALKCGFMAGILRRVFISYTSRSEPVSRFAAALYRDLRAAGAKPFLDRASIPAGVNWLANLNDQINRCDVCVCILDEQSVQSGWVAAELQSVLESRRISSMPDIFILVDPALKNSTVAMLPLFRGVLQAASEPQLPGQPQIIWLSAQTRASFAWSFGEIGIFSETLFSRAISGWLEPFLRILEYVSNLGLVLGAFALAAGWIVIVFKLPFVTTLARTGWLPPLALVSSYSLGYVLRLLFACKCGLLEHVNFGACSPGRAMLGLIIAMMILGPHLSPLLLCWCLVAPGAGWLAGSRYVKE